MAGRIKPQDGKCQMEEKQCNRKLIEMYVSVPKKKHTCLYKNGFDTGDNASQKYTAHNTFSSIYLK
jgi:hypothetical protein